MATIFILECASAHLKDHSCEVSSLLDQKIIFKLSYKTISVTDQKNIFSWKKKKSPIGLILLVNPPNYLGPTKIPKWKLDT